MIETVQIENRSRDWRGNEKVTIEEYTRIEGTVTATGDDNNPQPGHGRTPIYTIDAGDTTVTVANPHGIATDMHPVQVGDRVRILADSQCVVADYTANTVDRI
jgi:hypothetical protein